MMRIQQLVFLVIVLLAGHFITNTKAADEATPCDPNKDRHCFPFGEIDVESSFNGVGEVVEAYPVEDDEDDEEEGDTPTATTVPTTDVVVAGRSSDSNNAGENKISAAAIAAMSVGGALLLVGAAVMRRRQLGNANNDNVEAVDSTLSASNV